MTTTLIRLHRVKGQQWTEIDLQDSELADSEVRFGRSPDCEVLFPSSEVHVGRFHAQIQREGNRFKLIDLSRNGTYINGKRIQEAYLKNGDVIAFADPKAGPKVAFQIIESDDDSTPGLSGLLPIEPVEVHFSVLYGPALREFTTLPIVLGGENKCDWTDPHPALSARHARILYAHNQYWIEDLTGFPTVLLNGQPISARPAPAALEHGMRVDLSSRGPSFCFERTRDGGRLREIEEPFPENVPMPRG